MSSALGVFPHPYSFSLLRERSKTFKKHIKVMNNVACYGPPDNFLRRDTTAVIPQVATKSLTVSEAFWRCLTWGLKKASVALNQ